MDTLKKIILIISVAAVVMAAVPLFGKKYLPTQDGEYHIIRIVEFAGVLGRGVIVPRWAPDLNSGYGIPIFNFHYPLPNYVGSFVRVFTRDAVYAFQMSQGLGYLAIALGAYFWLSALFGTMPAAIGALAAAYVPYLFVDVYVRGSVGEVWALVFLFLALFAFERKKFRLFAVGYGLLILSHNIMAMLFTPVIAGYILMRDKRALIWMAGGAAVSAFFWIPALLESKYVVGLNTVDFREHFAAFYQLLVPSWGTGFSGTGSLGTTMSLQIGIAPLIIIIGALWTGRKGKNPLLHYFFAVLVVSIFLMLGISRPVWEAVKPLQLIQYPWRLLSFVIPVTAYAAAYWVQNLKKKAWALGIALVSIMFAVSYANPVRYEPRNEAYYMSRPNFTRGTSSMGNSFSTIWTGWKDAPATKSATLYFPGWKAFVGGREVPIENDRGVIKVLAPEGVSPELRFTETPVRAIADIISLVATGVILFL